jgi:hypothetical protein
MTAPHIERLSEPQEVPPRRLLDATTAASYIGVQTTTLAYWRCKGKGPRYHKVGRHAFYAMDDIETWLDAQAVVPVPKKSKLNTAPTSTAGATA